jgi:hypothetical protein
MQALKCFITGVAVLLVLGLMTQAQERVMNDSYSSRPATTTFPVRSWW